MALDQTALQAVLASATEETFLETLKISHSDFSTLRLVNDKQNLTRSDGDYIRFPFKVRKPSMGDEKIPRLEFTASAVDQRIVEAVRKLEGKREKAQIVYEVVRASAPDTVQWGPVTFELGGANVPDPLTVKITATFLAGALSDAFPSIQFSPGNDAT